MFENVKFKRPIQKKKVKLKRSHTFLFLFLWNKGLHTQFFVFQTIVTIKVNTQ